MKILIVDDDPTILELLKLQLSTLDYEDTTIACSGPEALGRLASVRVPFDCILLDISMPHMSGIEAIPLIRQTVGHADVPIVMLTALSDRASIAKAFVAEATDYIVKPFEFFEVEAQLHRAEMQRSQRRTTQRREAEVDLDRLLSNYVARRKSGAGNEMARTGLIGEAAFEACYLRIRRETSARPVLFAFRPDENRQNGPQAEVGYFMRLADEIEAFLSDFGGLATYTGDRTFLILTFETGVQSNGLRNRLIGAAATAKTACSERSMRECQLSRVSVDDEPKGAEPTYLIFAARQQIGPGQAARMVS